MTLFTLSATTRRVTSGKGNYSKTDAILGKQYPTRLNDSTETNEGAVATDRQLPKELSSDIALLQLRVKSTIDSWYGSDGRELPDLTREEGGWHDLISLSEKLYDPVLSVHHSPSTLSDKASLAAAAFASLATAIEEKLSVLSGKDGDSGVLQRAVATLNNKSILMTDVLLTSKTLQNILYNRIDLMKYRKENPPPNMNDIISRRIAQLKEAPLPHRLTLFEIYGGGAKEEGISNMSIAGSTNASDTHCKLVNHIFKVAFRKWGPGPSPISPATPHLFTVAETHALTRYILREMGDYSSYDPVVVSTYYCDYYDYIAYTRLPEHLRRSSIVPGSYDMKDLPFKPFAIPSQYRTDNRRLFKHNEAIKSNRNPNLCFDYGECLCYFVFGMGWDKHLGDIVDSLECCSMSSFPNDGFSGVFKDTHNFNRLGGTRLGVSDLALRSVAKFIKEEAFAAATAAVAVKGVHEEEVGDDVTIKDEDGCPLHKLRTCIRNSVRALMTFVEEALPGIVIRLKKDLSGDMIDHYDGDYGDPGEFECLTAHLFLTRLADECHVLRNTEVQRTIHSTSISLLKRKMDNVPDGTRIQTYGSLRDIPRSVLEGLSGDSAKDSYFFGDRAVVSWDGSSGRVVGLWRNSGSDYLHDHKNVAKKYEDDLRMVKTVKATLREASERGGLNPIFFSREAIYQSLNAGGIFSPGVNLTEERANANDLANPSMGVPFRGLSEEMNAGEMRGFFSGFRDLLETKALTVYSREAFSEVGAGIKTETEALSASAISESSVSFMEDLATSFDTNVDLGLEFSEERGTVTFKGSEKSLLEESRALRSNEVTLSSVMTDMGIQVSETLDEEFAAEMRETYPDSAIREMDKAAEEFEKSIPASQSKKLDAIGKDTAAELEEIEQNINDTELSKATDTVLGKRVSNGVTVFAGRFATTTVMMGSVAIAGFLGPATVGTMHASRGAHLNVVDRSNPKGVTTYKMPDFSCTDHILGWAKKVAHPFREEIDATIESDPDFFKSSGAHVVNERGEMSKNKAWAPICGDGDTRVSDCGSWATYDEPGSVLPWVRPMADLPVGQSLSCDKGLTALQAVSNTLLSLGRDIAREVFEVVEEAVVGVAEKAFSTIITSPAFIVGVPIAVGIAATRLQMSNWKTGLAMATAVFILILIVRFFVGSGFLTLNWFGARDSTKRKNSEVHERGSDIEPKAARMTMAQRGDLSLRPVFSPATTSYVRSAQIIGINALGFPNCYAKMRNVISSSATKWQNWWPPGQLMGGGSLTQELEI
uniref:Wsv011-like protein n=1 Tax=Metapenaeus ensis nimavirus TaxID=2133794 RepID=A0A401IPF9_9VIRU|nr:MAG: wsv011-like protein [Metapenaeus ensis nimavirus]GBG35496.1 wsv011-like protein [Metapenaeus ensis nimavirus]